jgi:hypothetical protein
MILKKLLISCLIMAILELLLIYAKITSFNK